MLKEIFLYIFLSTIIFKIFQKYFSILVLDKPSFRSSHNKVTPTSGGLVFLLIHFINILLTGNYKLLILLPIGILGFFDDVININQLYRLIFQSLNISIIYFSYFNFSIFNLIHLSSSITFLISLFLGLLLVNCINFMDGIDGLVASNMSLIFLNYAFVNNRDFLGITICLFVFLFYNWCPAKLFMGDSGSTFLGIILFFMIFTNKNLNSSLTIFLTASPLLMDSITCILRRLLNRENIFSAHNKHLYQRLQRNGMKHSKVTLIYTFSTFLLLLLSHFNNLIMMSTLVILLFIFGIYLEKRYAMPFKA